RGQALILRLRIVEITQLRSAKSRIGGARGRRYAVLVIACRRYGGVLRHRQIAEPGSVIADAQGDVAHDFLLDGGRQHPVVRTILKTVCYIVGVRHVGSRGSVRVGVETRRVRRAQGAIGACLGVAREGSGKSAAAAPSPRSKVGAVQ